MKKITAVFLVSALLFLSNITVFAEVPANTYIRDIITIASGEVNSGESSNSQKYNELLGDSNVSWSCAFLTWCAYEAAVPDDIFPKMASSEQLYAFFMDKNEIKDADKYSVKNGDIVFFGTENNITFCGIVTSAQDGSATIVIGDYDNTVAEIRTTAYFAVATPDYGTQSEYLAGMYMTTASLLNFRSNHSTDSQIFTTIPMGTIIKISEIYENWGKTSYNGNVGWVSMDYATPYDDDHSDSSDYSVRWNVIDVSKWQGTINWTKVINSGIKGVILRLGLRGSQTRKIVEDDNFLTYYKGASAAGLHVGVYFYSTAKTIAEVEEEAEYTVDVIKKNNIELSFPVYVDMEDSVVRATGRTMIFNMTNKFMSIIESENLYAGTYCNSSWANDYYTESLFSNRSLWIADWHDKCGYTGNYGMWQYSERGSVSGIEATYTDLNICYVDYPSIIADISKKEEKPDTGNELKGDVNCDGTVTAADARTTLRFAAGMENLSKAAEKAADVDDNGKVTASDARTILRVSAGMEHF